MSEFQQLIRLTPQHLAQFRELLQKSTGPWVAPAHQSRAGMNGQVEAAPKAGDRIQIPQVAICTPNGTPLGYLLPLMAMDGPHSAQGIVIGALLRASVPVSSKILVASHGQVAQEEMKRAVDDWMLLSQIHQVLAALIAEVETLWSEREKVPDPPAAD